MKVPLAVLVTISIASEKKVPPRHPIQRLNRLVEFSHELLDDWFNFLPSQVAWKHKVSANADRMQKNFMRGNQRCGYYDENKFPHGGPREKRDVDEVRYNRENPKIAVKQLTTGFRKWAERYISNCSGQRYYQFQTIRMDKWNDKLQSHLDDHEKKEKCKDRMILGGNGTETPAYLSVENWEKCIGSMIEGSLEKLCEPNEKPSDCPDNSWEQLFGECGVSIFSKCQTI